MKHKILLAVSGLMVTGALLASGTASAQTAQLGEYAHAGVSLSGGRMMGQVPGVFGVVSAVSGNTITITAKSRPMTSGVTATAVTYTVDATSATITKNGGASTISGIAVGDMVMVQGTVNGTSVTATAIRDGMMGGRGGTRALPAIQGNGQPIVGGAVTAINGTTLTITNKSNVTYTVDASNAKVAKGSSVSTLGNIGVGDTVIVQGMVTGTSVTASSVIDQGATSAQAGAAVRTGTTGTTPPAPHRGFMGGLFGGIGNFLHTVFGF